MLLPYIEQMYGPSAVAQSSAPAQLPFPQAFPSSQTSAPANSTVQYGIVNEITSPLDLTAAIQSKPAVVVDFTSPRCGPCVQIAPYYAQLATYVNNVIFVSVNTLQSGLVAMQWYIRLNSWRILKRSLQERQRNADVFIFPQRPKDV